MKKIFIGLGIILIPIIGFFGLNSYIYNEKQGDGLPDDYKNITFSISDTPVTLQDGGAQVRTALSGEALATVRYFGNEIAHDVNGDGVADVTFLITQETASGEIYFYAVAAIKKEDGYLGSRATLIGDRIAPQTTEKGEGRMIIINYADRLPLDPKSTLPSINKSLWLLLDLKSLEFGEVVRNFEGESR